MKEKTDIELNVFKHSGGEQYKDLCHFDDEIEFINFDKKQVTLTDRIRSIGRISNRDLLMVTTIFFALFVVCEVIGGLASHSLSLLGDAGAMTIDVCSYGFNLFAEHMKSKENQGSKSSLCHDFMMEIVIPGVSVMSLLAVTGWVCSDAILRLLGHKQENVNILFLYSFAFANLVVDVICAWLFYIRREDVFLQKAKVEQDAKTEDTSMDMYDIDDVEIVLCSDYSDSDKLTKNIDGSGDDDHPKTKNMNMISAFTHVGGDTLRSFTVLLAAMISSTFSIDATITDAVAAIIVSVTIIIAVLPLLYSLGLSMMEYKYRLFSNKTTKDNYKGLKTESEDLSTHTQEEETNSFPLEFVSGIKDKKLHDSDINVNTVCDNGVSQDVEVEDEIRV